VSPERRHQPGSACDALKPEKNRSFWELCGSAGLPMPIERRRKSSAATMAKRAFLRESGGHDARSERLARWHEQARQPRLDPWNSLMSRRTRAIEYAVLRTGSDVVMVLPCKKRRARSIRKRGDRGGPGFLAGDGKPAFVEPILAIHPRSVPVCPKSALGRCGLALPVSRLHVRRIPAGMSSARPKTIPRSFPHWIDERPVIDIHSLRGRRDDPACGATGRGHGSFRPRHAGMRSIGISLCFEHV
jgi:hypothetical protein